jgi:uncharacterized protein (TIGR02145 family)
MKHILKNLSIIFFFLIGATGLLTLSCSSDDGNSSIKGDKGTDGADCDVENDDVYFVMKCGEVEKARWAKAMCGKMAYDPEVMECSSISNTLSFRFVDERDGIVYKALIINSQIWMAENLSYVGNGNTLGKCYNDSIVNCYKYGGLYNWETAKTICPEGWHLPTDAEWDELYRNADGNISTHSPYSSSTAGKYLKSKKCNGMDTFGFAALPSGYGNSDGSFSCAGDCSCWWSASEFSSSHLNAHYRYITCEGESGIWGVNPKTDFYYSVRCIKD